jgi:LAS superfamily LD-carboxypeptidase LdcB
VPRPSSVPPAMSKPAVSPRAQALDWLKHAGREPGFLSYYRMLAEERTKADRSR